MLQALFCFVLPAVRTYPYPSNFSARAFETAEKWEEWAAQTKNPEVKVEELLLFFRKNCGFWPTWKNDSLMLQLSILQVGPGE